MKDSFGRAVGTCIVGLGLLAFVISAPAGDTRRSGIPEEDADAAESAPTGPAGLAVRAANTVLAAWPEGPQRAARMLIEKYGPPAEISEGQLVWHDNGPWKRTVVFRDELEHNFPTRHFDSIQQSIHYKVPAEKIDDLAKLSGSLIVDRTGGLLSSRCDREESNFLALNLAHDVVRGQRGIEEARKFFGKTVVLTLTGKSTPYSEGLLFRASKSDAADPDKALVERAGSSGATGTSK